jgi:hypothetical protein
MYSDGQRRDQLLSTDFRRKETGDLQEVVLVVHEVRAN